MIKLLAMVVKFSNIFQLSGFLIISTLSPHSPDSFLSRFPFPDWVTVCSPSLVCLSLGGGERRWGVGAGEGRNKIKSKIFDPFFFIIFIKIFEILEILS